MQSNRETGKPKEEDRDESEDDSASESAASEVDEDREGSEARRLFALRNHRISFDDAIDSNGERVEARPNDIIFGRGRGLQNHPGNVRMRQIVEKYKVQYHSLNRKKKQILLGKVYKEITEGGVRFVKKLKNDGFVIVDAPISLQKVCHTLRCRKSIQKKLLAQSQNDMLQRELQSDNISKSNNSTSFQMASSSDSLKVGAHDRVRNDGIGSNVRQVQGFVPSGALFPGIVSTPASSLMLQGPTNLLMQRTTLLNRHLDLEGLRQVAYPFTRPVTFPLTNNNLMIPDHLLRQSMALMGGAHSHFNPSRVQAEVALQRFASNRPMDESPFFPDSTSSSTLNRGQEHDS